MRIAHDVHPKAEDRERSNDGESYRHVIPIASIDGGSLVRESVKRKGMAHIKWHFPLLRIVIAHEDRLLPFPPTPEQLRVQ
jgi:hypothetical protein